MGLDVLDGQLHVPRRNQRRRALQGLAEVVRPDLEQRIDEHFLQARRHQRSGMQQQVELAAGGQLHQGPDAL
ncbi:hypothetical protein D3C80_2014420 [compost metagenome]